VRRGPGTHRRQTHRTPAERFWTGRRASTAVVLVGVAAVATGVAGMVGAGAAAEPGSGLGAIDVTSHASGFQVPMYSNSGEDVEAQIPWATVSMQSGGATHALTSVYWPGDTGGHGGDTLKLLGTPCILFNPQGDLPVDPPCVYQPPPPPDSVYQSMNDPYKAEAQSGSGQPVVTGGGQGVSMRAVAHATDASAQTTMSGSQIPSAGDTFGETTTVTSVKATGPLTLVVDATTIVHNVSLAGGAITIDSVISVAHAVSDTVHGTGTAQTTVNGMKIGGVPVTVDSSGVHAGPQNAPLPGTDQLNTALKQTGFQIYVAKPTKTVKGAAITLDSGSLVLFQTNSQYNTNANDTGRLVILGGAGISADTGKGFDFSLPPLPAFSNPSLPGAPPPPGAPSVAAVNAASGAGSGAAPVLAPQLTGNSTKLPSGLSPGWVVLVLAGSGLVAAAMRRLPDRVLAATGPGCPLGEGH
jgi:hypothetical protein